MLRPNGRHIIYRGASESSPRAILLFLGWGMDAAPFASLEKPGYDIIALYDYTDDDTVADISCAEYQEVVVVAWSFGVRAAADFLRSTGLPVTRTVAVNGTEPHVDDSKGIPRGIFEATLEALSEASVKKFRRRMFGPMADYRKFEEVAPRRGFDSLKAELEVFAKVAPAPCSRLWSLVVTGERDLIFPADNQRRAWRGTHMEVIPDMPHFADFQMVLDRFVVDKELVATRFANASGTYDANAAVQHDAAAELWRMVGETVDLSRGCGAVLEVGAGSGMLTRLYLPQLKMKSLKLWDLASLPSCPLPGYAEARICDAESGIDTLAAGSVDLLLSSSTLQWFHAPDKFLRKAAEKIAAGGAVGLMYYAQGTCRELALAGGMSLTYPEHEHLTAVLADCGMRIAYERTDAVTIEFDSPREALLHLRTTGVNALNRSSRAGAAALSLMRHYPLNEAGKAPLTFVKAYIIAIKD